MTDIKEILRAYKLSNAILEDKNDDLEYKNEQILTDVGVKLRKNNEKHETEKKHLESEFNKNILELDSQIQSLQKEVKDLKLKSSYWEVKYRKDNQSRLYNYFWPSSDLKEDTDEDEEL